MNYIPEDERLQHPKDADVFERLSQDARLQPLAEQYMDVKSTQGMGDVRRIVQDTIRKKGISAAALARRIGVKPSAISEFLNDKWKGSQATLEKLASDLGKAINQIAREHEAAETVAGGDFVSTRQAAAIQGVVQYAIKRRMIATFLMPAGLGKTMAMKQLYADTAGSVLITARSTRGTVLSFLQLWARALGLQEIGRAEDVQERIIGALEDTSRVTFIDEAHKLSVKCLDAMREVYDAADHVPIILAATPSFYQKITTRRVGLHERELLDQFYSRVGVFRDLSVMMNPETGEPEKAVTQEDVATMFARGKVRIARDGLSFLSAMGNLPGAGGYRACRDLVQTVIDLFPGELVTARLLNEALTMRVGIREAGFRAELIAAEEDQERQVAVG